MTRKDFRSQRQFKKDIKAAHLIEGAILKRWLTVLKKTCGRSFKYIENGCGPDGEYLRQKDVSTDADYYVTDIGYVEVKFSKMLLKENFHLKTSQVKSYIKQRANILMVDGWNTEKAQFTFITPEQMEAFEGKYEVVAFAGMGFKLSYKINVNEFIWRPL